MVTFDCPWCAEPAVADASQLDELACERCAITVEIAAEAVSPSLERAA